MGNFFENALPAVSFGAGLANSFLNFHSQREVNEKQIDLMREQNNFNARMMEKQMDWNDPRNQVQRLSAAGLNPALTFNDSSGSVDMPSGASVPQMSAPQTNFSDVALNSAQALNLLSQSNLNSENAKITAIDKMYRDAYNMVLLDKLDSERGLNDVQKAYFRVLEKINARSAQSQVEAFALANEKTKLEFDVVRNQAEDYRTHAALNNSLTELNWKENDYRVPLLKASIKATLAKAARDYAEIGYIGQLKWNTYEDTLRIQAERHGLKLENSQIKALWPSVKEQIKLSLESDRLNIRQQKSDYWNPFRYAGMVLGGAAAGGVGGFMRNSGLGGAKRVVVRGFVP